MQPRHKKTISDTVKLRYLTIPVPSKTSRSTCSIFRIVQSTQKLSYMKRLKITAAFLLFASFSCTMYAQSKEAPYKAQASNITLGDQAFSQKVLWAWKYYDDNTLDKAADLFADTAMATLPDGTVLKGKEALMKALKDYRNSFTSAASTVEACVTLKSPDMPGLNVVSIWGTETDTNKDGTVSKMHLNEVWMFNKDGKVVAFHQLAAKEK